MVYPGVGGVMPSLPLRNIPDLFKDTIHVYWAQNIAEIAIAVDALSSVYVSPIGGVSYGARGG